MMLFLQVPIPAMLKGRILDDMLPKLEEVPHIPVEVRDYKLTNIDTNVSDNSTLSVETFFLYRLNLFY
jgi:hypothetical protein